MKRYQPQDATTNPSLIFKALQKEEYTALLDRAVDELKDDPVSAPEKLASIIDRILILFGLEILKIIPGRVSTEVDARLSFDTRGTVERARKLIADYKSEGIDEERILIKIASTWEGIQAARILQREGINCNMTVPLFASPSSGVCRSRGPADFPIRRPNHGLAQGQDWEDLFRSAGIPEFSPSRKSIPIIKSLVIRPKSWAPPFVIREKFLS